MSKIYVGNLSYEFDPRDLEDEFGKFGPIENCSVKRGFAFVHYTEAKDAETAVKEMDGQEWRGRRLKVAYAMSNNDNGDGRRDRGGDPRRDSQQASANLFVANIPPHIKMRELEEFFDKFGKVENVKILPQARGNVAMSAFVDFSDVPAAKAAHEAELVLDGQRLRTDYNFRGNRGDTRRRNDYDGRDRRPDNRDYDGSRGRRGSFDDRRPMNRSRDDDYDYRRGSSRRDRSRSPMRRDRSRSPGRRDRNANGYNDRPRDGGDYDRYGKRGDDREYRRDRSPRADRSREREYAKGDRNYSNSGRGYDREPGNDREARPRSASPPRQPPAPRDASPRRDRTERSMSPVRRPSSRSRSRSQQ